MRVRFCVVLRNVAFTAQGELPAGQAFEAVMRLPNQEAKRYWTRLLAESASDPEDREMLVTIHRDDDLVPAQSAPERR